MLKRSSTRDLLGVALVGLLIVCVSCGGGGGASGGNGSSATAGSTATAGDTAGSTGTVLSEKVQVLGAADARKVTDVTPNSVTINGDASKLTVGSVLVSGQGNGLLRTITAATPQGPGVTVLQTSPASLENVFNTADFIGHATIGAAQIAQFFPAGPGITMQVSPASRQVGTQIVLNLDKYTLSDQNGATISFTGSLIFSIDCDLHFKLGLFKITKASCVVTLKGSVTAQLDCAFSKTFTLSKIHLGRLVGEPVGFLAGEVPVIVVPTIDLYSVLDGSVKLGANLTASADVTGQVGLSYANGSYQSIHSLSKSLALTPKPNFYGSATASYSPLHAEVELAIYDVAGPYASFDLPRFDLSYTQGSNPAGKQVTAEAVFQGTAGLKAMIFGHSLADHEFPGALRASFSAFDHFFPDDGSTTVGIN